MKSVFPEGCAPSYDYNHNTLLLCICFRHLIPYFQVLKMDYGQYIVLLNTSICNIVRINNG